MPIGKRITFDEDTYAALDLYARESMRSLQELADEAFELLLKKHGRPVLLKDALKASVRSIGVNDNRTDVPPPPKPKRKRK